MLDAYLIGKAGLRIVFDQLLPKWIYTATPLPDTNCSDVPYWFSERPSERFRRCLTHPGPARCVRTMLLDSTMTKCGTSKDFHIG